MPIRILLIDDNPLDRELALRALRRLPSPPGPAECVCANDWDEAVSHIKDGGFDLLLLDYNLPRVSGLDVLHALRDLDHPPVIMTTGQEDVATAVETLRAGAYDYVTKSVDWGPSLRLAVERVLDRVRLERELADSRSRLAEYATHLEDKVAARTAVVRAQAAEIEALYLKSEEAARLKSEIVGNMSHELRTPLNIIVGYTEVLADSIPRDDGDAEEVLANIRSQADKLRHLVDTLLTLSRLNDGGEAVTISRFTVGALTDELRADAIVLNTDHAVTIEWTVSCHATAVVNDREKVRSIAYHLLSNAIKFTPAGEIEIAAEARPDGGLRLTVRDTGIGLPPEARTLIFEDFRQLDGSMTRRHGGVGLGLGIVRRYTALLGGALSVESAPGIGTTIVVDLPAQTAEAPVAAQDADGG